MASHILEDSQGRRIKINVDSHDRVQSFFTHLLIIGEDRLGQCAGHGICGQCHFKLKKGKLLPIQDSLHELPENEGLACSTAPSNDEDSHIVLTNHSFAR